MLWEKRSFTSIPAKLLIISRFFVLASCCVPIYFKIIIMGTERVYEQRVGWCENIVFQAFAADCVSKTFGVGLRKSWLGCCEPLEAMLLFVTFPLLFTSVTSILEGVLKINISSFKLCWCARYYFFHLHEKKKVVCAKIKTKDLVREKVETSYRRNIPEANHRQSILINNDIFLASWSTLTKYFNRLIFNTLFLTVCLDKTLFEWWIHWIYSADTHTRRKVFFFFD